MPILLSKKTTKKGRGGQKLSILRQYSLWTAPYEKYEVHLNCRTRQICKIKATLARITYNIFEILEILEHTQSSYNARFGFGKISQLPNSHQIVELQDMGN